MCSKHQDKLYWEPIDWKRLRRGTFKDALAAGYQKDISSYLYVGRVRHPKAYKVGKVIPPRKQNPGLWIWEDEQPLQVTKFELLKINRSE